MKIQNVIEKDAEKLARQMKIQQALTGLTKVISRGKGMNMCSFTQTKGQRLEKMTARFTFQVW